MEPLLGLATEYSSNPYLLFVGPRAASDVAVLFSDPIHYDLDSAQFSLTPSARYSDSGSYASLNSNYLRLSGGAQFAGDLDLVALKGSASRDSSFYQYGLASNGAGVRSDADSAGISWQHTATERFAFGLDGNWSRTLYSQEAPTGLVDYRYFHGDSFASYTISERNKANVVAGVGQYLSLDGITGSRSYSLQLGFDRQLTEIWKLSSTAGYSRSTNSEKVFYGPFFIGTTEYGPYLIRTVQSDQNGPVYSASVTRQGETLNVIASASRAYVPSGFEFLSREDIAELDLAYAASERWKFSVRLNYQKTATPQSNGVQSTASYFSGQFSADWNWTTTWIISLHANWLGVRYQVPPLSAESTGLSLEISRQFLRIEL